MEHWIIPLNFLSPLWQKLIATILQMKILGLEDRSRQLAQDQCMEWSGGGIQGPRAWDPHIQQPLPSHPSPDLSPSISRTLPPLEFFQNLKFSTVKENWFSSQWDIHSSPSLVYFSHHDDDHVLCHYSNMNSLFYLSSTQVHSHPVILQRVSKRIRSSQPFSQPFPPHSLSLHHHLLP